MTRLEPPSPSTDRGRWRPRRRAAFTLVESLIASVVLAVAVVGISGTLAATYQQSRSQVAAAEATQLGRQLMEEISAKPFAVPPGSANNAAGWSAGNANRATYDDVSDYHGYNDVSTNLRTLGGATQSFGTAGPYARSVAVANGPVPVGHVSANPADFKRVTVTVTRPNGDPIVLTKFFTNATLAI